MAGLKTAIEDCLRKRAKVYEIDAGRIERDLGAARSAITDHAGRWLFELIQNSDDARPSTVEIHATGDALYVCDDGTGFAAEAV